MDQKTIHEITGRAMTDPAFREGLRTDPEGTLRAAGYSVTQDLLDAIKAANKDDLDALAGEYEKRFATAQADESGETGGSGPMG